MASVGSLVVDLEARTAKFNADLGKATAAVETAGRRMTTSMTTFERVMSRSLGPGFIARITGITLAVNALGNSTRGVFENLGDDIAFRLSNARGELGAFEFMLITLMRLNTKFRETVRGGPLPLPPLEGDKTSGIPAVIDIGPPKPAKSGSQEYLDYIEELREARKRNAVEPEIAETTNAMQGLIDASQDFGSAIGTAFEDAVLAGEKFRDVLGALMQDIARIVLRATVTKPLEGLVGSLLGGMFGSGVDPNFIGPMPARAAGGPVMAGSPYLVGEEGPELFVPGRSGSIVPNGGGGGGPTVQVFIGSGVQRGELTAMMPMIKSTIRAEIMDEMTRGRHWRR